MCSSVGWLIHENAKRLVVAASISQTEFGNKQYIPVKMIVSRAIIKKAKPPKPKSPRVAKSDSKGDTQGEQPVKHVGKASGD